jgi:beta-propeller repeat-containing protein/HYR domain-containing protein
MNTTQTRKKRRVHHLSLMLVRVLILPLAIALGPWTLHAAVPEGKVKVQEAYGKLPLHFEANQGQTASQVKFLSRGSGYTLFLTPTEAVLGLKQAKGKDSLRATRHALREYDLTVLRMKIEGANPSPRASGLDPLPGIVNYFLGNDPAKWRTNVPTYARVGYQDIYPGIDLVFYGNQRQLEYDFVVRPGADPSSITLNFQGADRVEVDAQGDLVLYTAAGTIRQRKPLIYQEVDGVRTEVQGGYVLRDRHRVTFQVAAYDISQPLVIDPVLFSTYLGGSGFDEGFGIAVDAGGNAYVTGFTGSTNFPTTEGAFDTGFNGSFDDVFVTKLNPAGTALVYSTFLGGNGFDEGYGIAVDTGGNAYVTGLTGSTNFPTTAGAFQTTLGGGVDAFVTKLAPTGAALVYSTYLGGSGFDEARGIAADASGNAYVTGQSNSNDFPTTAGAFQTTLGGVDAVVIVAKLNPAGAGAADLVYSTYLGGSGFGKGRGIAVDAGGNVYVTGQNFSSDFPTTAGAFQTTFGGSGEAFVAKLNPAGAGAADLLYSTYLGGSGFDEGFGIAVDTIPTPNVYVTGFTSSSDFPTTVGTFDTTLGGEQDAFVTKLNPAGTGTADLVYATYLGGSENDESRGIAVDADGNAYVTGGTFSSDFPVTNSAFDTTLGGFEDAFVTKLNPTGATLVYATYLGGSDNDESRGIAVDAGGNAYVTGGTFSSDFPTAEGALQTTLGGVEDAFVAKITDGVLDTTPPVTTALPSPMPNASGWNSGDVMVTLSATDTDSEILQITYSASGAQFIASTTAPGETTSVLITAEGVTTITFFAVDTAGNQEDPKTVIVQIDRTPPTITAPPDVTVGTGPGATLCNSAVPDAILGMATASDNSGIVMVTRSAVPAGNIFPVGATLVTYTATDSVGHVTSARQTVTVNDSTAPVLPTPSDLTANATSPAGAVVTYALPGANDNCPGVSVSSTAPSGSTFAIGTTIVTVTATDAASNSASKTFQVTVVGEAGQTTNLMTLVRSFDLGHGIEKSLLAKLGDALAAINAGKVRIACQHLDSFMQEVRAQSRKKITAVQAAQLLTAAAQIKAVLGCR